MFSRLQYIEAVSLSKSIDQSEEEGGSFTISVTTTTLNGGSLGKIGCCQNTARSDVTADMETFLPSTSQVVNVRVMRD